MRPANRDAPLVPYIRQSRAKEKTISLADQWDAIKTWADRTKVKLLVSSLDATKAAGLVEQNVSGATIYGTLACAFIYILGTLRPRTCTGWP